MTTPHQSEHVAALRAALDHPDQSIRLRTAMAAGTRPDPAWLSTLLQRCAVEPDFFVRDMLTWALTQQPTDVSVPRLIEETRSHDPQARSQALHTLSKVGDPAGWAAISPALLRDQDDEVARSAWRAAVTLVPESERADLASHLVAQLGRGDRDVRMSLSRALAAIADAAATPLRRARLHPDPGVRTHARATEGLIEDPESGFDHAVAEAERSAALRFIASTG